MMDRGRDGCDGRKKTGRWRGRRGWIHGGSRTGLGWGGSGIVWVAEDVPAGIIEREEIYEAVEVALQLEQ